MEATGTIQASMVVVLFDFRATNSFISPYIVEHYGLVAVRQDVSWEVELTSGARVSVSSMVHSCPIHIGKLSTMSNLHITPLGSYDVVLGMDWLYAHSAKMDCRQKRVECVDDDGISRVILGVKRPISLRMISAMQLRRCMRKGCQLFAITISDREEDSKGEPSLDDFPILQEFADVFPSELPGRPPPRAVDFHIDLVPGLEPVSRAPYRMITHELSELKI